MFTEMFKETLKAAIKAVDEAQREGVTVSTDYLMYKCYMNSMEIDDFINYFFLRNDIYDVMVEEDVRNMDTIIKIRRKV